MGKLESVVIVDNNEIDNFINCKIFESHGATNIHFFNNQNEALDFLIQTKLKFQFVIVCNNPHTINGFDFIDRFNKLGLNTKHNEIILLSAFYSPEEIKIANKIKTLILEKPLVINDLLSIIK